MSKFYSYQRYSNKKGEYIYYNPECKECTKKRSTNWMKNNYKRHRELWTKYQKTAKWREFSKRSFIKKKEKGYVSNWQKENKGKIKLYNEHRKHKYHDITSEEWEACKEYFSFECAYCGMTLSEHIDVYEQDFHKDHVDHEGSNGIENCIPACKSCNSQKHTFTLDEWYNEENERYSEDRMYKILDWLFNYEDYL